MFVICHCFVLSYPPRHSKDYYIRLGFILHSKFRYDYRQWDDCISQSKFLCRLEFTLKSEYDETDDKKELNDTDDPL